ncbi:MAG: hypothetical protein GW762_00965 [Candidatus Pacebacteria bacterium]|nr:hypothetical protein [Candidatus Paceibacterota bacterium]
MPEKVAAGNKISQPELAATKYQPQILKLAEMALSISDSKGEHYISEAGNSRYGLQEIFVVEQTTDGEKIVLIEGKRVQKSFPTWELTDRDLVKLGNFLGYVPVTVFFANWEPGLYNDRDFVWEFSQKEADVKRRLSYIEVLVRAVGATVHPQDFDQAVWALTAQPDKRQYLPEDLLESYTEVLLSKIGSDKEDTHKLVEKIRESVKRLALFTKNEEEFIVQFYYVYADLKKVDFQDIEQIVDSLRYFPFVETLLKKFQHQPDANFSDNLLGALSRFSIEFYEN